MFFLAGTGTLKSLNHKTMCKFYSAIVMRNGDVLHNENLLSHEDLIRLFNINDSQVNCDKFIRVEFCPDDYNDLPNISKYNLKVDEENIPDWFEQHREFAENKLRDIIKNRIITSDQKILTGGLYVISKDVIVNKVVNAYIYYNSGTVTDNSGTVTYNSGTVTYNSGTVTNNSGTVTYNYGTIINDK